MYTYTPSSLQSAQSDFANTPSLRWLRVNTMHSYQIVASRF